MTASGGLTKKNRPMNATDVVIATFPDHPTADAAIRKLIASGFKPVNLSVAGKAGHPDSSVTGISSMGDRVRIWGIRGAFWGGLWGLLFGGLFLTLPVVGNLIVLGILVSTLVSILEDAAIVGGLGALGAALFSLGVPSEKLPLYEADVSAGKLLVMAHGSAADVAGARKILEATAPDHLDTHSKPDS
jgi:hypothetical protein